MDILSTVRAKYMPSNSKMAVDRFSTLQLRSMVLRRIATTSSLVNGVTVILRSRARVPSRYT